MSDILEKKIKELEQQVESYKVYKDIIDFLNIDIYWKDGDDKILGANKHFVNTLGKNEKDIIGKLEQELVVTDNIEEITGNEIISYHAKTDIFMREKYIDKNTKNGNFFTQRKIIKNENDNIEKIIVISIDVNQFKDTNLDNCFMVENLDVTFQQIINAIDANIYWKNTKGEYIGMNRANADSLKISDIKDALYKTEVELLDNEEILAKNILIHDLEVIQSGATIEYEETYPTKDNQIGIVLSKKSCLRDREGKIIGLVGVSVDITKQKRLQAELQKKNIQ
ncbi:PAS domain-containing protein [Francisella sp. TX07-6608]|uniref:PAS domain-containing protein n=1 Tax=Francisella sp. TX07-6608 TaxID=573568 RepID=UPI0008F9BD6A|nr:PAS domain-containing protein [Francisella sp. TX07-6608]OIN84923.1 sensory box protein [Francisella sp. TX07-6608]